MTHRHTDTQTKSRRSSLGRDSLRSPQLSCTQYSLAMFLVSKYVRARCSRLETAPLCFQSSCVGGELLRYSHLRSLKYAYVSSGSHDLAGRRPSFFLMGSFFLSFILQFLPYFSYSLFFMTKNLPDKEQTKEGLRRRLESLYHQLISTRR